MAMKKTLLVVVLLLLVFPPSNPVGAVWEEHQIYDYNYSPFLNVTYLELRPGGEESFQLGLENRFDFTMENVSVEMELYRYRTLEESLDISDVEYAPTITADGGHIATTSLGAIEPGEGSDFVHPVRTVSKTPSATYLIRVVLEFDVNGTSYIMKSRGHFDNDLWQEATANRTIEKDVHGTNLSTGGIDLDILGVDGIIPETSITVHKPISMIPLYLMAGITGFVGLCALVFYLQEEHNMFPQAEWAYQRLRGKWITTKLRIESMLNKEKD